MRRLVDRMAAGNVSGSSQSAAAGFPSQPAEETASTSFAGIENVLTSEVLSSQASYKGDSMAFGSESDTVCGYESNGNLDDLYSLDKMNNFLDVTFKNVLKLAIH